MASVATRAAWSLGLLVMVAFQGAAVWDQRVDRGTFPSELRWALALAEWDMFSRMNTHQSRYYFEQQRGGVWSAAPMDTWFPFQYCQGARWNRPTTRDVPVVRRAFLAAACQRSGAERVRVVREGWKTTLWAADQPPLQGHQVQVLETWPCERAGPRPAGREL